MPLLALPNELLLAIATVLPLPSQSLLSRTCHHLHALLTPDLLRALRRSANAVLEFGIHRTLPTIVRLSLAHGATDIRLFPLALETRSTTVVGLLLDHFGDAILNPVAGTIIEPLGVTVRRGDAPMVELLLARGARVDTRVLGDAAECKTAEVWEMLLGAKRWERGELRDAMSMAVARRNAAYARVLLRAGGNLGSCEWRLMFDRRSRTGTGWVEMSAFLRERVRRSEVEGLVGVV